MNRRRRQNGWSLFELLVYITVFAALSLGAYRSVYETITHSGALQRSTAAISAALRAGEHWRGDLRLASGPVQVHEGHLIIPQRAGLVTYQFVQDTVWRRAADGDRPVLRRVKFSRMEPDPRQQVSAWRWELELIASAPKPTRIKPLFSFVGVAKREAAP